MTMKEGTDVVVVVVHHNNPIRLVSTRGGPPPASSETPLCRPPSAGCSLHPLKEASHPQAHIQAACARQGNYKKKKKSHGIQCERKEPTYIRYQQGQQGHAVKGNADKSGIYSELRSEHPPVAVNMPLGRTMVEPHPTESQHTSD